MRPEHPNDKRQPQIPTPEPQTLSPKPHTMNPKPPDPKPLHTPHPSTLSIPSEPRREVHGGRSGEVKGVEGGLVCHDAHVCLLGGSERVPGTVRV